MTIQDLCFKSIVVATLLAVGDFLSPVCKINETGEFIGIETNVHFENGRLVPKSPYNVNEINQCVDSLKATGEMSKLYPKKWLKRYTIDELINSDVSAVSNRKLVLDSLKHVISNYIDTAKKTLGLPPDNIDPINGANVEDWYCPGLISTAVDSLSTLWLVGMRQEFDVLSEIVLSYDFLTGKTVSFFETNIRALGGLLSAYYLSGRDSFLDRAKEVAEVLYMSSFIEGESFAVPARNMRFPSRKEFENLENMKKDNKSKNEINRSGFLMTFPKGKKKMESLSPSLVGTTSLEFRAVSLALGEKKFGETANHINKLIADYFYALSFPGTNFFNSRNVSVGAEFDSAFEYLTKMYLQGGKREPGLLRTARDVLAKFTSRLLIQFPDLSDQAPWSESNNKQSASLRTSTLTTTATNNDSSGSDSCPAAVKQNVNKRDEMPPSLIAGIEQVDPRFGVIKYSLQHLSCFLPGNIHLLADSLGSSLNNENETNSNLVFDQDLSSDVWSSHTHCAEPEHAEYCSKSIGYGTLFKGPCQFLPISDYTMNCESAKIAYDKHYAATGMPDRLDDLAQSLNKMCGISYKRTPTEIGCEITVYGVNESNKTVGSKCESSAYHLRPEYIESLYMTWRKTGNPSIRVEAQNILSNLIKHSKTNFGFSELENVLDSQSKKVNRQESFLIAETLKYLYLIFSPVQTLNLDKDWVFSTEAHPLPVLPTDDHTGYTSYDVSHESVPWLFNDSNIHVGDSHHPTLTYDNNFLKGKFQSIKEQLKPLEFSYFTTKNNRV